MRKWHGFIGYAIDEETYPGVWTSVIKEHEYYGDVIKNKVNIQQGSVVNAGISINNSISIVADPFAYENFYSIRYITYLGKKWVVTGIEVESPRMILSIGGMYNAQ